MPACFNLTAANIIQSGQFICFISHANTRQMSSVNRVLEKRRKEKHNSYEFTSETGIKEPTQFTKSNSSQKSTFDPQKQTLFEKYRDYSEYNPSSFEFSNTYMPSNLTLYNKYRAPLCAFVNVVNQDLQYFPQSANNIPRCSCRAYMNYYNQITKKGYKCFACGRENLFQQEYNQQPELVQLTSPSYLVDGPQGVYNDVPPQNAFIFLVDVSKQAWQCKMLSYVVMVLKDVLSREELNQTQIYFYTYDETVHEYDFNGQEAQRLILDPSIKHLSSKLSDCFLHQIRDKLLTFLDSLEEIAEKNTKHNSNFFSILQYVYENVKHTGGKMFIFQANEAIIGENFTHENLKTAKENSNQQSKPKSLLQTKNKQFFNRFIQPMLTDNISTSFFIFGRSFKNIRVFGDVCKLTCSELFYYSKQSPEDLTKFYYDLYSSLTATYYTDVRIEFVIGSGWYFTAIYGNLYRTKDYISFKYCYYDKSKRACAVFSPTQGGASLNPYFAFQTVTNYIYGRKHYMAVNTAVIPFTTSLQKLFVNHNYQICAASIFKSYLSSLRLEEINGLRNKYIKQLALIWRQFNDFYKGEVPPECRNMFLSFLAFLKNYHSQIDLINDSLILEKIVSQRNLLQGCNYPQCVTTFSPYLFDLSTMGNDRCLEENFIYPDVCQLKFTSVKSGIFLLDSGQVLYLFISKTCDPIYLKKLIGKDTISRDEEITEQTITGQGSKFSEQIQNLLRVLRESKAYGYAPLYVVRYGQNTINEKNFYLNFYEEKYQEFRSHRLSYDEFVNMLNKYI